jgi:hypothetical protein
MLRFFLFMVGVMAASASVAGEGSPCPGGTAPIQIMTPGYGGSKPYSSVAAISSGLPHFRAFVETVTNHINSRLSKEKLCVTGAKDMESMNSATAHNRSLLQFVHWHHFVLSEYTVPIMTSIGGRNASLGCWIFSPWIDLYLEWKPVPLIYGVVYWNERQLLADQAILAGARNVQLGMVMPLKLSEFGYFRNEYEGNLIKERVPPDLLWLFRRTLSSARRNEQIHNTEAYSMSRIREKGAEGYTKLVLALVDRCFASGGRHVYHYGSILDVDDPVLLEQYKIDMPILR